MGEILTRSFPLSDLHFMHEEYDDTTWMVPRSNAGLKMHKEKRHSGLQSGEDTARFLRNLFEYPGRVETRLAVWLQMLPWRLSLSK